MTTRQLVMDVLTFLDKDIRWHQYEKLDWLEEAWDQIDWDRKESAPLYELCTRYTMSCINAGEPLPAPLDKFVLDVLDRRIKLKKPKKNTVRNAIIVLAIREAIKKGELLATRNDESKPCSACDLVAECLKELGYKNLKYKAVVKIWTESRAQPHFPPPQIVGKFYE